MDTKYEKCATEDSTSIDSHLLADPEADLQTCSRRARRFSKDNVLAWAVRVLVFGLALCGIADLSYRIFQHFHAKRTELCYCGETLEEALSMGCEYDQMASAWLPTQCIDRDLRAKYAELGNRPDGSWNYWADVNRTTTLTADEVSLLAGTGKLYYMDWEWHAAHCVYYWEKETRLSVSKAAMEPRYESQHHLDHCRTVIFSDRKLTSNAGVALRGTWSHELEPKGEKTGGY